MRVVFFRPRAERYASPLVLLPGLWTPPEAWSGVGGFLGHRGWEGHALELHGLGGIQARAEAVVTYARSLARPPVLVGHGAGALVGLLAAREVRPPALVMLAPPAAGMVPARALTRRWGAVRALVLGRPVPPPRGPEVGGVYGVLPAGVGAGLVDEPGAVVLDVVRGRTAVEAVDGIDTLLLHGVGDPLLPDEAARAFAERVGAERRPVGVPGHWLLGGPGWQAAVGEMHRWLVQALPESSLEYYEEAMADRAELEGAADGGEVDEQDPGSAPPGDECPST